MKSVFVFAVVVGSVVTAACVGGSSSSNEPGGTIDGGTSGNSNNNSNNNNSNNNNNADGSSGGTDAATDHTNPNLGAPKDHRAAATPCSHDRGPGNADTQVQNAQCEKDADCTDGGTNGRCVQTTVAAHTNYCSYDSCFADTDCAANAGGGANQVCTCRESSVDSNRCSTGNCKVDADCGVNGYCSPSVEFDKTNFGINGYYCHTSSDACVDDSDCVDAGGAQSGAEKCAYDDQGSHSWTCSNHQFLPP